MAYDIFVNLFLILRARKADICTTTKMYVSDGLNSSHEIPISTLLMPNNNTIRVMNDRLLTLVKIEDL